MFHVYHFLSKNEFLRKINSKSAPFLKKLDVLAASTFWQITVNRQPPLGEQKREKDQKTKTHFSALESSLASWETMATSRPRRRALGCGSRTVRPASRPSTCAADQAPLSSSVSSPRATSTRSGTALEFLRCGSCSPSYQKKTQNEMLIWLQVTSRSVAGEANGEKGGGGGGEAVISRT